MGYTVIPDEILGLDLDIYETIILAVIYGFSQDGESSFTGSWNYLAKKAKCSRRKVALALPKLVGMGLIRKFDRSINGVHFCQYRACINCTGGARDAQGDGACDAPNNTIDNENIDIKSISKDIEGQNSGSRFEFKKSLMELGVSKEVADAWMRVRRNKRATNTEIAFDRIASEIVKSGKSADECIRTAVEHSWQGFEAAWLNKPERKSSPAPAPRKESAFEHNLRVLDQLNGTHLHEQYYGNQQNIDADEQ